MGYKGTRKSNHSVQKRKWFSLLPSGRVVRGNKDNALAWGDTPELIDSVAWHLSHMKKIEREKIKKNYATSVTKFL